MKKNSKVLVISVAVIIVAIAGVIFFAKYYPTDETPTRTLVTLDDSENNGPFSQIALSPPCELYKRIFHFEEKATGLITYSNPERGLAFQVPYNPRWGAPDFRFNPYDQFENDIQFGTVIIFGCDGWNREFALSFTPAETKEELIARIEKNNSESADLKEYPLKINSFDVDGKTIVQYTEGLYESGATIVIGKKHNYVLYDNSSLHLPKLSKVEDIIKSMQFID